MDPLDKTFCPGCGSENAAGVTYCGDCGYENSHHGYLLSIREIAQQPSYPAPGAFSMNQVSPAFIKAVLAAASTSSGFAS